MNVEARDVPLKKTVHLETKTYDQLMDEVYIPKVPLIDGFLYPGTYLYVGAPKVGKSFFMLQVAYHVSKGISMWDMPVNQAGVLYLALEDDFQRLQQRLSTMFGVDDNSEFHMAVKAENVAGGLLDQIMMFLKENPNTKLVIIDTLQKIRGSEGELQNYGADYEVISKLKAISDNTGICILVVHHTRKQKADDSFDMISGSNGLLESADGAFVMDRLHNEKLAKIDIAGRDQPSQQLIVRFDEQNCNWILDKQETDIFSRPEDPILKIIDEYLCDGKETISGSASELLALLQIPDIDPSRFSRRLNVNAATLLNKYGIRYERLDPRHSGRKSVLTRIQS